jgi:hypothetical protein
VDDTVNWARDNISVECSDAFKRENISGASLLQLAKQQTPARELSAAPLSLKLGDPLRLEANFKHFDLGT